ncbi:hypothetical protein D3C72_914740 [compost metagenome]
MELHAPGLAAPAEGMAAIQRRARQHGGTIGYAQHGLQMGGMGREVARQALEQGVLRGLRVQCQFNRSRFAPGGVVGHFAAQRVGQQLVAVADAEHRHVVVRGLPQPGGTAFAPFGVVGDEGGRAGHQHAGEVARIGQVGAMLDVDHDGLVFFQASGHPDPVRKAPVTAQRRHGAAGFKDQEGRWIHPGEAVLTGLPRL